MTNQRLSDILDEVTDMQRDVNKLLSEAVVLSGRAVGDEMMLRGRRVQIIRLEANVAAPYTDGERRRALSLRVICAPYRADGSLMKRNPMVMIERLAMEWARLPPTDAEALAGAAADKRPSPFAHGLEALQRGVAALERRKAERRSSATK